MTVMPCILSMNRGLELCSQRASASVVVLGHPEYYPRFGFLRSLIFGINSKYGVREVFMELEMRPESLSGEFGTIKFHAAFSNT